MNNWLKSATVGEVRFLYNCSTSSSVTSFGTLFSFGVSSVLTSPNAVVNLVRKSVTRSLTFAFAGLLGPSCIH